MKKKKVLFLYNGLNVNDYNAGLHYTWINDREIAKVFEIYLWGKNFNDDFSLVGLKRVVDVFKPDYIYGTVWKRYMPWLPDISTIKVPKIFVECDTGPENQRSSAWYSQWDKIYTRTWWPVGAAAGWRATSILPWSIAMEELEKTKQCCFGIRKGIKMIGSLKKYYTERRNIAETYKEHVCCKTIEDYGQYWGELRSAAALICSGESHKGAFIPAKLLEYLSSGAAVITNCEEIEKYYCGLGDKVLQYIDVLDLGRYMQRDFDFVKYQNIALEALREHTHLKRYKELFV